MLGLLLNYFRNNVYIHATKKVKMCVFADYI